LAQLSGLFTAVNKKKVKIQILNPGLKLILRDFCNGISSMSDAAERTRSPQILVWAFGP